MAGDLPPPAEDTRLDRRLDRRLAPRLDALREADLYRVRRQIDGAHGITLDVEGRRCLNFCSNDYLGLAADPRVAQAAQRALNACGTGSGASALISGYNREHRLLEEALAAFTGYPRVLLFSSGWAANCGVLRALLGREDVLIADELNHASLIDGGRLSGARYLRVPHADAGAFAKALRGDGPGRSGTALKLLATDSVFSMDGDLAPLSELAGLCERHGAALMIDDAHGFGVLGARGRGAIEHLQPAGSKAPGPDDSRFAGFPPPDVYSATLGKALGVSGAFVAGSHTLIEYLIQRARSWVFSTAPPPALAAAAREALRILVDEPQRRQVLRDNIGHFVSGARARGIALGPPESAGRAGGDTLCSAIMPLVLGDSARTLKVSQGLFESRLWVAAIRTPTVPAGTARLRITLSAAHRAGHIEALLDALAATLQSEPLGQGSRHVAGQLPGAA